MLKRLKFGKGNAKLSKHIGTFSLPAGHTCPSANICLSKAKVDANGVAYLEDGPNIEFRCFAAFDEAIYKNTRLARWHNFDLLKEAKTTEAMAELIYLSLPAGVTMVRVHVSGDFFNQAYFNAWILVAERVPELTFYAYTKSVNYWVAQLGNIPKNFVLTASIGGKHDALINEHDLNRVEVFLDEQVAMERGLEIDHDDSHAYNGVKEFGLLIHGSQPKGSKASLALSALRTKGIKSGYTKKK